MFNPNVLPRYRSGKPSNPLKLKDLIIILVKLGYRYYKPASKTWKMAFVISRAEGVLCILIRKNGIDLRYYDSPGPDIKITGQGISMRGGVIYRNHYNEAKNLITQKIKIVASTFAHGKFHDEITKEDGRSYQLNPEFGMIKHQSMQEFQDRWEKMKDAKNERDIADYIRDDCGGYLGGGEWL